MDLIQLSYFLTKDLGHPQTGKFNIELPAQTIDVFVFKNTTPVTTGKWTCILIIHFYRLNKKENQSWQRRFYENL